MNPVDDLSCDPTRWSLDKLLREKPHGMPAVLAEWARRTRPHALEAIANAVAEEYGGGYEKAEEIVRQALGVTSIYENACKPYAEYWNQPND